MKMNIYFPFSIIILVISIITQTDQLAAAAVTSSKYLKDSGKGPNLAEYMCSVCVQVFQAAIDASNNPAFITKEMKTEAFYNAFDSRCSFFNACDRLDSLKSITVVVENDARKTCQNIQFCPVMERWQSEGPEKLKQRIATEGAAAAALDLRISKAYGARGYNKIRISAISNTSWSDSSLFTYEEIFKNRWTDNYLHTAIVDITPGQYNQFTIHTEPTDSNPITVSVYVPNPMEGVRGVIIADPCFQSQWIICVHQNEFDTFNRMTSLLNAINAHDDVHYWMILGDNFYDQSGEPTKSWFDALSLNTKSKIMASVPGNHDFWVHGSPLLNVSEDQYGNGFMQFYAQDVAASYMASDNTPYDFSTNPDDAVLPPLENFFFYHAIGNTAFIGFSGAHSFEKSQPYFEEACNWAESVDPAVVLLLGHWNGNGDGCDEDMTVPAAYNEMLNIPACANIANRLKYVEGHTHCNRVVEEDVGFMVAGQGMTGCGDFGFPVFDTTGDEFSVYYFPIQQSGLFDKFDNYEKILSCIEEKGVTGCYDLATKWSTVSLI